MTSNIVMMEAAYQNHRGFGMCLALYVMTLVWVHVEDQPHMLAARLVIEH
jgi:hypothetical protein